MRKFKKVLVVVFSILMGMFVSGCGNRQIMDLTYTFNRAIIELPNGEIIEGKVDSWRDFDDGDQLQIVIDGVTYLVHSSDAVLIKDWYEK